VLLEKLTEIMKVYIHIVR